MKKSTLASPDAAASGSLDVSIVAELAKIAARHDLSEVEVEHAGLRVRVARERRVVEVSHVIPASRPAAVAPEASNMAVSEPPIAEHPGAVKSPMVGTAYLRPSPESKPFVEIGTVVKAGEKILLVEAMKTYNEIVATRAGRVTHIFVEDGSPVEYGQPLMVIE
jgi:acetyl-CoA carboxylase biotin carboxyl carrier protein